MKKAIIVTGLILLVCSFTRAQSKPKTIVFPKGKNTVTLKGNTARENSYVFRTRRNQQISISITSSKGNALFHFDKKSVFDQGFDFMCEDCKTMSDRIGPGLWMISVFHAIDPEDKGPTDFVLKVTVK